MDGIARLSFILENLKDLTGQCGWEMPEDLCTANELILRKRYEELSTQYYILRGLIPEQSGFIQNQSELV